jgi:signal transduction histidine kinase
VSLTTRLTAYFLAALALFLAGFSVALYGMARSYFLGDLDARLGAALDVLAAAAEVEPDRIEWDPAERALAVGRDRGAGEVRWAVYASDGRRVDASVNAAGTAFLAGGRPAGAAGTTDDGDWRVAWRALVPRASRGREPLDDDEYDAVTLVAGVTSAPAHAALNRLAWALGGVGTAVWLLAAALGRALSRRALAPVARMADAAGAMTAVDLAARLPSPRTGDELDRLCDAFNGLLSRLQEAFERQRRFTGDAAHQLRTPLTAMLGQIEVARRRDRTGDDYRRVLDVVHEEGVRLSRIVEALLFLARAEDGGAPELETLDLAAWLDGPRRRWAHHPRGADIHFEVADDAPVPVRAHPALLGELIDNLLDNACKYSEPGQPITVRLSRDGGAASLAVA